MMRIFYGYYRTLVSKGKSSYVLHKDRFGKFLDRVFGLTSGSDL